MYPASFLLDVLFAVVCYIAFTISGVALLGWVSEVLYRRKG